MARLTEKVRLLARENKQLRCLVKTFSKKKVRSQADKLLDDLTEREMDVAILISMGHSNEEIQKILFLSKSTIKNRIVSIYQKLGVKEHGGQRVFVARLVWERTKVEE